MIDKTTYKTFLRKLKQAREGLAPIDDHNLEQYANTLINGCNAVHALELSACNDRLDLVQAGKIELTLTLWEHYRRFTRDYLGLDLADLGDVRGSIFKLKVPSWVGDDLGDRTLLCVPHNESAGFWVGQWEA